jgi:polyhydroxyalkanoate synthesis regulator phasin
MADSDDDSQQPKGKLYQTLDALERLNRIAEPDILRQIKELKAFTTIPGLEISRDLRDLIDFSKPTTFEMPSPLSSSMEAQEALYSANLKELTSTLNSYQSDLLSGLKSTFYDHQSSLLDSVRNDLLETAKTLSASNIFKNSALSIATETLNMLNNDVLGLKESMLEHSRITDQLLAYQMPDTSLYNDWEESYKRSIAAITSNFDSLNNLGVFEVSPSIQKLLDTVPSFVDQLSEPELLTEEAIKYVDDLIRTSHASIELTQSQELAIPRNSKRVMLSQHQQTVLLAIAAIIIPLVFDAYLHFQNSVSTEKLITALSKLEDTIGNLIDEVQSSEKLDLTYVVTRDAPLRRDPNSKATQLSRLYPNQEVQIIKQVKGWAYVSFYDSLVGIPKMGWVSIRHLREVQ